MGSTVLVGLGVNSGAAGSLDTATFDHFSVSSSVGPASGWVDSEIGGSHTTGSTEFDSENWTMIGSGLGAGTSSDDLHFVSTDAAADGNIVAHVLSQTASDSSAAAGISVRSSTDASAASASLSVTPGGMLQFQIRGGSGTLSTTSITSPAASVWLNLYRSGSTVKGFYSTNGTDWTQIGSNQSLSLGSDPQAGLFTSANSDSATNTATFASVAFTPVGWTDTDINSPAITGSSWYDGTTWTVYGNGVTSPWQNSDQFDYVSTNAVNSVFIARLTSQTSVIGGNSGIMFRESNAANSAYVFLNYEAQYGNTMSWRSATGGSSASLGTQVAGDPPVWLKLVRHGENFAGYSSTDGTHWTLVDTCTASLSATALAGLGVSSWQTNVIVQSTFDNVSITPIPAGLLSISGDSSFASEVHHTATVSVPFTDTDADAIDTATIDWGDGTTSSPDASNATITEPGDGYPGTIEATHIYTSTGTFTTTISLSNDDGSTASAEPTVIVRDTPPSIATAAAGVVATDGKSIALSVLGADALGESNLTYSWDTLAIPAGAGIPTFSATGTHAAQNSTATLSGAGDYTFEVTITNTSGLSITSDVDVTVGQIPAELSITPGTATVAAGDTQEFDFSGSDQFGAALDEPALDWTATDSAGDNAVSGDDGTIDSFGFYTAPTDNAGAITITAKGPSSASASASASVNVPVTTPNLTAAEGSDGSHIDLNWDFDDTALNNAAGFDLEREATGASTYTTIATITDPTTTAYTDTAVSNGTTYAYRLKPYVLVSGSKVFGTAAGPASVTMVGMVNASADDPILVNSGSMATISLPFSDSNASATHTATIDWGDGTTGSPDVTTATVTEASGSRRGKGVISHLTNDCCERCQIHRQPREAGKKGDSHHCPRREYDECPLFFILPFGSGRGEPAAKGKTFVNASEVIASVSAHGAVPQFKWKRDIVDRSWFIKFDAPNNRWNVSERSNYSNDDTSKGGGDTTKLSPTGKLYSYDNSGLRIGQWPGDSLLGKNDFLYEEKEFTYHLQENVAGSWVDAAKLDIGQAILMQRVDTSGNTLKDWKGLSNTVSKTPVKLSITTDDIRSIVQGNLAIQILPDAQ